MIDEITKPLATKRVCDELTLLGIQPYDKLKVKSQPEAMTKLNPLRRSMTIQDLMIKDDGKLKGYESLTQDEINMLIELEEENSRRGNFERIFPAESNMDYYSKFFECKRYENILMMSYLRASQKAKDKLLLKNCKRIYNTNIWSDISWVNWNYTWNNSNLQLI